MACSPYHEPHLGAVFNCGDLGHVLNATHDRALGPFPVGSVVTYTCHTGSGGGSITCEEGGIWTQKPTCHAGTADCGYPPEVPNASRDRIRSKFPVGTVMKYTCNGRYQERGYATCLPNGQWIVHMPTCTGMNLV